MSKPKDPLAIRVGDYFHLRVPDNRTLQPGLYKVRVDRIITYKHRKYTGGGQSYRCSFPLTENHEPIMQDTEEDVAHCLRVYFTLTIYSQESRLAGQAFLGPDQFPVEYSHEQNIMQRLQDSLPLCGKDKQTKD